MRTLAALSASLVLTAAAAGCTHAPWRPHAGWEASKSKHVTVYTDAITEHRFSQEWLERSHVAYQAFFPKVKMDKVDVLWVKSEPGWFGRVFWPNEDPQDAWSLETVPSGGKIGRDGLIVLETRNEHAAAVQLAHLFIEKAVPNAPLWLHVGLARYMAKGRVHRRGDKWVACFGSAVFDEPITASMPKRQIDPSRNPVLPNPTTLSSRGVAISLDEVLYTDWYRYDAKRRHWYEYTAYAFVHFLIHGRNGWHGTRFPVLLEALGEGKSTEEALGLAYPHILDEEWEAALAAHLRPPSNRALVATVPTVAQGICMRLPTIDESTPPERAPVDEAAIRTVMDDLQRVEIFRRHSGWFPEEIVAAEAAKRPGRGGRGGRGPGPDRGGGAGRGGTAPARPGDPDVPTIRGGAGGGGTSP